MVYVLYFYVDDTQFSVEFPADGQSAAYCRLCGCLDETRDWMTRNRLKLNDDKADLLLLCSTRAKRDPSLDLKLPDGSCCLIPSDSVRNLGVTLDSQLTMERHVRGVCRTASFHLRSIGRIRRLLDRTATRALVHAFLLYPSRTRYLLDILKTKSYLLETYLIDNYLVTYCHLLGISFLNI